MSTEPEEKISPRRAKTRARLIEAAAEAITDKGFSGTTLDEIAARAGLTKGAIYDNFDSKDALFMAVMRANPSRVALPKAREGSVAERMAELAANVLDDEQVRLQIPLRAEFLLYSLGHPEMRPQVAEWLKVGFADEHERLLEAFSPEELPMAPEAFVVLLQAMIPGLMYLRSQAPNLVSEEIVREIFEGLGKKG